jgi:hypothetical protein
MINICTPIAQQVAEIIKHATLPADIAAGEPVTLGVRSVRPDGRSHHDPSFRWPWPGQWTPRIDADPSDTECSRGLHIALGWRGLSATGPVHVVQIVAYRPADVAHVGATKLRVSQAAVLDVWDVHQMARDGNLSGADLRGANLRYADLSDANLSDANLRYADLSGANLSDANLRDASLSHADLSGANLYRRQPADASAADLSGANLYHANLPGANLYRRQPVRRQPTTPTCATPTCPTPTCPTPTCPTPTCAAPATTSGHNGRPGSPRRFCHEQDRKRPLTNKTRAANQARNIAAAVVGRG